MSALDPAIRFAPLDQLSNPGRIVRLGQSIAAPLPVRVGAAWECTHEFGMQPGADGRIYMVCRICGYSFAQGGDSEDSG